jgi:hypothetical protein
MARLPKIVAPGKIVPPALKMTQSSMMMGTRLDHNDWAIEQGIMFASDLYVSGKSMLFATFAYALLLVCLTVVPGHAEKRVAFVIGNSNYEHAGRLEPRQRCRGIGTAKGLWHVVERRSDVGIAAMRRAIGDFSDIFRQRLLWSSLSALSRCRRLQAPAGKPIGRAEALRSSISAYIDPPRLGASLSAFARRSPSSARGHNEVLVSQRELEARLCYARGSAASA